MEILVAALVVVLLVALIAAVLRLRNRRLPSASATPVDDLPAFLESPPGCAPAGEPAGWATLSPLPRGEEPPPPRWNRRDTGVVLTAVAAAGVLVGIVAVAALAQDRHHRPARAVAVGGTTAARLTFTGVVLEPRAVGVTVTYPVVQISTHGDRSRARIEFPTFNCLAAEAPADPVAAGCQPSVTEYADVGSPQLSVDEHGAGLTVRGRFPTETHPNGGPPVPTGGVYDLRITVSPVGRAAEDGWRTAEGVLELGPGTARTVDSLSVLRSGS